MNYILNRCLSREVKVFRRSSILLQFRVKNRLPMLQGVDDLVKCILYIALVACLCAPACAIDGTAIHSVCHDVYPHETQHGTSRRAVLLSF